MIVCAQCGESNVPGSEFCGACGTYLEWEPKPAPVPDQVAAPAGPATARPHQPVPWSPPPRGGPAHRAPEPGVQPPEALPRHVPPQLVPPQHTQPQPVPTQPVPTQPVPVQPGAVQPADRGNAGTHRPRLTERRTPRPGDLICGQCGEPNPPTRKFCARCGSALVEAAIVPQKWWRKLLPARKPPEAGSRPTRRAGAVRRRIGKVLRWSFVVALLTAVGAYGLVPSVRSLVNTRAAAVVEDVKGVFVTDLTPVRPTGIAATAESPGHPPGLAFDNATNTFWLAPVEPRPPALVLDFGHEVDLREAIVRVGNPDDLQGAHRPKKLHLVYPTGRTFDVDIADTPDPQTVRIEGSAGASSVEVHVVEWHGSLRGNEIALAEIEFFAVR
jgi:ribosomal protein L40E